MKISVKNGSMSLSYSLIAAHSESYATIGIVVRGDSLPLDASKPFFCSRK